MSDNLWGRVLEGESERIAYGYEKWAKQPVDMEQLSTSPDGQSRFQRTIVKPVSVTGPGTFLGKAFRKLTFEPSEKEGWWLRRDDLPDSLPIRVSVNNVWTTVRNIVLLSGSPRNYVRMVEHIIALRTGMVVDNVVIRLGDGDPPLFDRGSMDLVEAIESSGIRDLASPATYVTVKEPVTVGIGNGGFLTFRPCASKVPLLNLDCAVDFRSAIGKQRIRVTVNPANFRYGALARTNTTFLTMLYCKTIGKLFADVRHLGYSTKNILIAGRHRYFNEPKLIY